MYNLQVQVMDSTSDYREELNEYYDEKEKKENLGLTIERAKPSFENYTKFADAIFFPHSLQTLGFTHVLVDAEMPETLTLSFADSSAMVVKDTPEARKLIEDTYKIKK